jgi:nucleotide-binding universal stress UspA family protein
MNENGTSSDARVVVGVDGSAGSREALRWALAEARLRKAPLRIVHAWRFGYEGGPVGGYGYLGYFGAGAPLAGQDVSDLVRKAAEDVLDRAVGEVAGADADVEIERWLGEGAAAEVLVGAVAAGDLLVVGSRGHGGFADLLLGSVSQKCVHHALCPVVVVHPPQALSTEELPAAVGMTRNAGGHARSGRVHRAEPRRTEPSPATPA